MKIKLKSKQRMKFSRLFQKNHRKTNCFTTFKIEFSIIDYWLLLYRFFYVLFKLCLFFFLLLFIYIYIYVCDFFFFFVLFIQHRSCVVFCFFASKTQKCICNWLLKNKYWNNILTRPSIWKKNKKKNCLCVLWFEIINLSV